jgi:hypothetical protein
MGLFDELLNDVGAHVAAIFPAQPPAIRAAVDSVARALLGDAHAAARIAELGARAPHMQPLFGAVHRRLMDHPNFQHALYAAHLHRHPLAPHHPKARVIGRGVQLTMHALEEALPGLLLAANAATREEATGPHTGRLHGSADGGVPHVHARASHGSRHGPDWRRHHLEPEPRELWEGPWGWGADAILDEREELGDLVSPDDQEPEWNEVRSWGARD